MITTSKTFEDNGYSIFTSFNKLLYIYIYVLVKQYMYIILNEKRFKFKKKILSNKVQDQKSLKRSSHRGSVVTNPTSICEDAGLIPGLAQ